MYKDKRYIVIILFLCVFIIFGALIIAYVLKNNNDGFNESTDKTEEQIVNIKELEIISESESGEWITVETTYDSFKFRYPVSLAEIIDIKAINEDNYSALQFSAVVDRSELPAYTIYFNKADGVPRGTFKLDSGSEITVSVEFEDSKNIDNADMLPAFNAVQETFNDVIVSMREDSRFTEIE